MQTATDLTQDAPGFAQANENELARAMTRYHDSRALSYPRRASAQTAAERTIYRLIKAQQQRGALVFVQIGQTVITFGNDAARVSRACGIAECRHLRLRRAYCDALLSQLRAREIEVVLVDVATLTHTR